MNHFLDMSYDGTWIPCTACVGSEGTSADCHWCRESGIMNFGDYLRHERVMAMNRQYMAERYNFVVAQPRDLILGTTF